MSNKTQKLVIRVICVILAVLMAGSVLLSILPLTAGAVTKEQIDKLEGELDTIQQQLKEITSQINSLEYSQAEALAKKTVLDNRMELTQALIDNLTDQIAEYGVLIEEKEQEVADRQVEENEQWDKYKVRIRAMEENGTISYYAILFGARDFADMLSRMDMISSIMDYDEHLYDELVTARKATEDAKAALEQTKQDAEGKKVELQDAQKELETQIEEAGALIESIENDINAAQKFYDQVSEEEDALKDKISELQKEYERQNSKVVGTGRFIWPTTSNVVTSGFGGRNTGISGASTNHKGIDIRAGYGAPIYAADSGTVLISQKVSSYGNYITIGHGNGYTTLYGHMSRRLVSAGDTVTQGQLIGYAGATGVANAPHLHFEIWKNGTRVNPLDYFDSSTYRMK